MFVHTDIVILSKFVSALIEYPGYLKPQFFMESFRPGIGQYYQPVYPMHILGMSHIFYQLGIYLFSDTFSCMFRMEIDTCLLYTSPSPRDKRQSRMPSSA